MSRLAMSAHPPGLWASFLAAQRRIASASLACAVLASVSCFGLSSPALAQPADPQMQKAAQFFAEAYELQKIGKSREAVEKYRAGLGLAPNHAQAHFYLGNT